MKIGFYPYPVVNIHLFIAFVEIPHLDNMVYLESKLYLNLRAWITKHTSGCLFFPLCCAFVQPCVLSSKFLLLLDKFLCFYRRRSYGIGCRIWKSFWLTLTAGAHPGGTCCTPGVPRPSSRERTVCLTLWRISWPFKVPATTSRTKSLQLCHTRCPLWPCKTLGNRR